MKLKPLRVVNGRLLYRFTYSVSFGSKGTAYVSIETVSLQAASFILPRVLNGFGITHYRYMPNGSSVPTNGDQNHLWLWCTCFGDLVTVCLANYKRDKIDFLRFDAGWVCENFRWYKGFDGKEIHRLGASY